MSSMTILIPGPCTTVQDEGLIGKRSQGYPLCGVLDKPSTMKANRLLDNRPFAPVLEIPYGRFSCRVHGETWMAVCGAEVSVYVNGLPVDRTRKIHVQAEDYLTIEPPTQGYRVYLAVKGGFSVPLFLGSASTCLKIHMGGYNGRALKAGDELSFDGKLVSKSYPVPKTDWSKRCEVRFMWGPDARLFLTTQRNDFLTTDFIVTTDADRMGIRLTSNNAFIAPDGNDILSDGVAVGSIQVPSGGHPIVLLADCQTTGGYAKIGTILSADLWKCAQWVPGDHVRFVLVSL